MLGGVDETNGIPVAMPEHTVRRHSEATDLAFNLPDDDEYGKSSGGRKTEPIDSPLQPIDPNTKTPTGQKGHKELKVLIKHRHCLTNLLKAISPVEASAKTTIRQNKRQKSPETKFV